MKKTTILIVMALLCLNFSAKAQAVDVTKKGLQIGQEVPDITLKNLHNYKDASGTSATTAKLSDFKGKLLILDFWATWCSPCLTMIPKMEDLQMQFGKKIQFLPITYQTAIEVNTFLAHHHDGKYAQLMGLTDEKVLHKLFPHIYLPHYVWIDGSGKVIAITGMDAINAESIETALQTGKINAVQKADMRLTYDSNLGLLEQKSPDFKSQTDSYMALTRYINGVSPGTRLYDKDSLNRFRITFANVGPLWLFWKAYQNQGISNLNQIELNVRDILPLKRKSKSDDAKDWISKHGYCFELVVGERLAPTQQRFFEIMREEVRLLFPAYSAKLIERSTDTWVLIRTSNEDKIKTKGESPLFKDDKDGFRIKNAFLDYFIDVLNLGYLRHLKVPVVNATGYTQKIDLTFQTDMSNIVEINKTLAAYDLKFVEQKVPINYLIISDTK